MSVFYCYAAATALTPVRAMKKLAAEKRPVAAAARSVGFVGFLYAGASIALGACGAVPLASAAIGIAPENYYFWQAIYAVPFAFLVWAAAAVVVRALGKRGKGRGPLKTSVALSGAAVAATLLVAWLPMAVETFFQVAGMRQQEFVDILSVTGFWQSLYVAVYIAAAGAAAALLSLAAASGEFKKGRRLVSFAAGIAAAAVLLGAFAIFIR